MLLDKNEKLVKSLDFRGTKVEYLDKISAKELFLIITHAQQMVNMKERFKAKELAPKDWEKTKVYKPILDACCTGKKITPEAKAQADRLFGVVIKQALIMTPLLFRQESGDDYEAATYIREYLEF